MFKFINPILLLVCSNLFMTYAWYGHLKHVKSQALWIAVLISWSVAFFEYCFQVPANRLGSEVYTLPQLKILQEIITMTVFAFFAMFFMKVPITRNYLYASVCMLGAAYFIFKTPTPT